jgi:hypothetical protein
MVGPVARLVATLAVLSLSACGQQASPASTPTPPPSASIILSKPEHSSLKDAHFVISGNVSLNGVSGAVSGEGWLIYTAHEAGHVIFRLTAGGQLLTYEVLTVDEGTFLRTNTGPGKWVKNDTSTPVIPAIFSPPSVTNISYAGEETLSLGKAWHVKAKDKEGNPFEEWVRERDGYPLKILTIDQNGNQTVLAFDQFNTGERITAPPADQVQ